jgi:hypothetical protein
MAQGNTGVGEGETEASEEGAEQVGEVGEANKLTAYLTAYLKN